MTRPAAVTVGRGERGAAMPATERIDDLRVPGLDGRIVVVTGAGAGQGAAASVLLARNGAHVIALDVREPAPELDASGLPGTIEFVRHDVADDAAWSALARGLATRAPVHGLVNNAGITHRVRLGAVALEDWNRVLAINLTGAMLGIQALAPLMTEGSAIVNVGSAAALSGHYSAAYTVSKWGLRGLTHTAATELGRRGIRVNIVHPGYIRTGMTADIPPAFLEAQYDITPLRRGGLPEEVAATVAFLLSSASGFTNGAEISIDGGQAISGSSTRLRNAAERL